MNELREWLPRLLRGLEQTVSLTFVSFVFAVCLGVVVAAMRLNSRNWVLYIPATIYVEVLRGTPLLLQLFFTYFGLPSIGLRFSPFTAAVIALALNTSAYLSEVFRGAISGVERGQWEASDALAMRWLTTMRYVVVPQATRIALPATGNYLIALFKDSALASTVSVSEVLFRGQDIASENFKYMQVYAVIAALYLIISYPTSLGLRWLERRIDVNRKKGRRVAPTLNDAKAESNV